MGNRKTNLIMLLAFVLAMCVSQMAVAGEIVAWGSDASHQTDVPEPNVNFIAIAGGWSHSLGLKDDGSIVAWGAKSDGVCDVPEPNDNFVGIACGAGHSLGLKEDGSIVAWGVDSNSRCDVPTPNANFVAVAGGQNHSLGLKEDGSIVAWGDNEFGQCDVPEPNEDFVAIAAGERFSVGLKENGSIAAWGYNGLGQCNVPAPNANFVAVAVNSAAGGHCLGLKEDGSIVAWGYNYEGQCDVPAPNANFVAVACGAGHSLGLKEDGSIVAWGDNEWGKCDVPDPNANFVAIAAGLAHSLGIKDFSMSTAFTYQGRLMDVNSPANGEYDLLFSLFDKENMQHGDTLHKNDVNVVDGYFTVQLDFGNDVFDGLDRLLEVEVRPGTSSEVNDFVPLSPRQDITPTPHALTAEKVTKVFEARDVLCDRDTPTASGKVISGTAASDGFIVGMVELPSTGNCVCYIEGKIGPVVYGRASVCTWSGVDYPTQCNSFTMPVRKGEFWSVIYTFANGNAHGVITVYWVPLGI